MSSPSFVPRLPAQLQLPVDLATALMEAAATARTSLHEYRRARRPRRGETLKPGADTPLWNELVAAVRAELTGRYGEKACLGRVLGLPRQRVNEFLKNRTYLPDAERALLLLVWLQLHRQGQKMDAVFVPASSSPRPARAERTLGKGASQ
jgi:hypothetical protein